MTSKTVDLLQEDSSVFNELVSQAGASLLADGSPVQLCKLLSAFNTFTARKSLILALSVLLLLNNNNNNK